MMMATSIVTAGCGGGGGGKSSAAAPIADGGQNPSPAPQPAPQPPQQPGDPDPVTANNPPTLSATPATQVEAGNEYRLMPVAQDTDGDTLAFSIENRPAWASFNTATGELSGTPTAQQIGTTENITISVSDGKATASLTPFSITVTLGASSEAPVLDSDAVALSWQVPTQTLEGELLGDLSGYRIYYGPRADMLTEAIEVTGAGNNSYVVRDLKAGTYYFAVRAVTENGTESPLSNVISREIG